MKLIKKIFERLSGYAFPQEYLCLEDGQIQNPLNVYLIRNGKVVQDVSNLHLFVGYKPLVFAFPGLANIDLTGLSEMHLIFSNDSLIEGARVSEDEAVARLILNQVAHKTINGSDMFFFEGRYGAHKFLSRFNQWAIQLNNEWFNKKVGNVFLDSNLYRQVQVAYAVPRRISLIAVKENQLFNLFPTDLHGKRNDSIYIISLRHEGMAAKQVESTRRILLSQIEPSMYKVAYGLGKNHMQPMKGREQFPFSQQVSEQFEIPVPDNAIGYYELTLEDSIILGIHRLFIFSITTNNINCGVNSLKHIHNAYATWRKKNGLPGNYLLR